MIVMEGKEYLSAAEACQMLGIKAATLYAYVSRGLLRSYRQGIKRTRLYLRTDVEHLTRLRGPGPSGLPGVPGLGSLPPRGAATPDGADSGDDEGAWIAYV
jgi:excisionase family DNA binding protein